MNAAVDALLKSFVHRFHPLTDEELLLFQQTFQRTTVQKKGFVLREGDANGRLFFFRSGIFRGYYNKNKKEVTAHFFFGPTIFADVVSITENAPVRINVQALEPAEVWTADMKTVEALGVRYPALQRLFLRFYETIYAFGQKRQLSFIFDSAEQRYRALFNERPKVIANMPLVYIASYLGIKPESLSRIRAKMTETGKPKGDEERNGP